MFDNIIAPFAKDPLFPVDTDKASVAGGAFSPLRRAFVPLATRA